MSPHLSSTARWYTVVSAKRTLFLNLSWKSPVNSIRMHKAIEVFLDHRYDFWRMDKKTPTASTARTTPQWCAHEIHICLSQPFGCRRSGRGNFQKWRASRIPKMRRCHQSNALRTCLCLHCCSWWWWKACRAVWGTCKWVLWRGVRSKRALLYVEVSISYSVNNVPSWCLLSSC